MKINVKLPILVHVDNIGAVFKESNNSTNSCPKHVDICTKYINQYIEMGLLISCLLRVEKMYQTYL